MVRGWRNDPAWVAHYAKRDLERTNNEINRMRLEAEMRRNDLELERIMSSLQRKPQSIVWDYSI